MRTKTLAELRPGDRAVVKSVSSGDRSLAQKLLTMGIVAGSTIEVLCVAPLGDPIQIRALDYKLSLRMSEAHSVVISDN